MPCYCLVTIQSESIVWRFLEGLRQSQTVFFCGSVPFGTHALRCLVCADYLARCSKMATAGNTLPSTNSKNAPPPVDM